MGCFLYRAFDAEGQLLYVGVSERWKVRLRQHSSTSPWYQYAEDLTVHRYRDRIQASFAEDRALKAEGPLWNDLGNTSGGEALKAYKLKRWEERGGRLDELASGTPARIETERERQFEEKLEHDLRLGRLMRSLSIIPGEIEKGSDPVTSDPSRAPVLERAMPAYAVKGSTEVLKPPRGRQVELGDGSWADCEVIAQARNKPDGWRVLVRWYDPGPPRTQREDWLVYREDAFREPQEDES